VGLGVRPLRRGGAYAANGSSSALEAPPGSYEIDQCQVSVEYAKAAEAAQAITMAKMSSAKAGWR